MRPAAEAERALLGEVLHSEARPGGPDVLGQLQEWGLLPSDFSSYHGAVYAAMLRLRQRGQKATPEAVRAELPADTDLHPQVTRDAERLADVLGSGSRATAGADTYAVMVLDESIRRRATEEAERLADVAARADAATALDEADRARRVLDWCGQRWQRMPREAVQRLGVTSPPTAAGAARPEPETEASAKGTRDDGGDPRAETEQQLLSSLVARPGQADSIAWLRPDHLSPGWRRDVYQLITEQHAAGHPVDPVTVTWLAERRGITRDVAPEALRSAIGDGMPVGADQHAREIHDHAVRAAISGAAAEARRDAANPVIPSAQLTRHASDRLGHITSTERPVISQYDPAEAPPPRPGPVRDELAERRAARAQPQPPRQDRSTPQPRDGAPPRRGDRSDGAGRQHKAPQVPSLSHPPAGTRDGQARPDRREQIRRDPPPRTRPPAGRDRDGGGPVMRP